MRIMTGSSGGRPDLRPWLGRTVTVRVDRPLGSRHPEHPKLWYPINYGFLPETASGDGEEIDAYLVGLFEPVAEFTGRVIGLIIRRDDREDKLVVAPEERSYTAEQIRALVEFQERFFETEIVTGL